MNAHNIGFLHRDDSNQHPQLRFLPRNKQNYPMIIIIYYRISTLSVLLLNGDMFHKFRRHEI